MIFLYKVKQGFIEKSYGIEIIKSLHFPKDLIKNAKNILEKLENN